MDTALGAALLELSSIASVGHWSKAVEAQRCFGLLSKQGGRSTSALALTDTRVKWSETVDVTWANSQTVACEQLELYVP